MIDVVGPFIAIAGVVIICFGALMRPLGFVMLLLALKPFVDLTMNVRFNLGGVSANALEIIGVAAVVGLLPIYISNKKEIGPSFNLGLIVLLFVSSVMAIAINGLFTEASLAYLIRFLDAYLIYLVAILLLSTPQRRLSVIRQVWLSLTVLGVVNVAVYLLGDYNVDVTRGVARYTGLYNDPGSPSYLATVSAIFGTLYMEKARAWTRPSGFERIVYATTMVTWLIILAITITKSAILMSAIFVLMWWGRYKRRTFLVLPALAVIGYAAYTNVDVVQMRFQSEVSALSFNELTDREINSLGSGRVARFRRLTTVYQSEFDWVQKLFGSGYGYGAHNQFLAYLMMIGAIGLFLFCLLLYRFTSKLNRLSRSTGLPEVYMAKVLLFCFLGLSLSGQPFEYTTLLWYPMFLLGLVNLRPHHLNGARGMSGRMDRAPAYGGAVYGMVS